MTIFINPNSGKTFFLGLFLLFSVGFCFSQNRQSSSDFWNRVRFGGGIGLNFSNGGFSGSIAPSAIYQFNEVFAAGVGANVNFYKFNDQRFWAYGPNVIVLANPIPQLQLSGEFEQLRVNTSLRTLGGTIQEDYWSPGLFLGAGYTTNFATVGIRYNVLHDDEDSIYFNAWMPFIRIYF